MLFMTSFKFRCSVDLPKEQLFSQFDHLDEVKVENESEMANERLLLDERERYHDFKDPSLPEPSSSPAHEFNNHITSNSLIDTQFNTKSLVQDRTLDEWEHRGLGKKKHFVLFIIYI